MARGSVAITIMVRLRDGCAGAPLGAPRAGGASRLIIALSLGVSARHALLVNFPVVFHLSRPKATAHSTELPWVMQSAGW